MLASVLPGLRDLRTPLAAGYLWLAWLWLLWRDEIPAYLERDGLWSDVHSAASALGSGPALAALTFVAFLIGSLAITVDLMRPIRLLIARREKKKPPKNTNVQPIAQSLMSESVAEQVWNWALGYWDGLDITIAQANEVLRERTFFDADGVQRYFFQCVIWQLPEAPPRLLLAGQVAMYDLYDRAKAEADFRFAISLPLFAITLTLFLETRTWWAFFLWVVLPFFLATRAVQKRMESFDVLAQAVIHGAFRLPFQERLDADLNRLRAQSGDADQEDVAGEGAASSK